MTAGRTIPQREYFAGHPVLRTSDLDEARHRIGQTFCDHRLDVHGSRADLAVRHNAVRGLDMSINYLAYGPRVTVDPGLLGSFYLFHIPLAGQARVRHRGEEMTATPARAAILNPDRTARLDWGEGCSKLLLQIDRVHLEKVARALVGAPLPGPIRFDMSVDLTSDAGRRLHRIVTACAEAVENGELFRQPLGGSDLRAEYDLAHALLTLQPSNVSHIIERADHQARPRTIRLALDYIHANLGEPITLADIAAAAGINVRTLQKGFQRLFGLTPMQVLRNARLDAAHYQLIVHKDPPSVSEAAWSCGFSHLGRFSRDYKERFGHSPSERRKTA
ncbi:MAG: AraC family transcriptional regulator [Stappia sp.]|uniref:AraC family transcriptional regulator n=1 Tax=Stappia sp. TaxID=1870903 RepID=UPI000C3C545B|nr:AraC family transcriptional regulator [Stappia sp.]MAA96771.1 AraC family transcriptional regulator [Stappia sp.]MBM21890.1 AraC family transcriptional regulator [Stappia sp.]